MPYKSQAQRKYFHANKAKLEAQGVNVGEWDKSSKGRKLPIKVKNKMQNVKVKKPLEQFKMGKVKKSKGKKSGKSMLSSAMKRLSK